MITFSIHVYQPSFQDTLDILKVDEIQAWEKLSLPVFSHTKDTYILVRYFWDTYDNSASLQSTEIYLFMSWPQSLQT